VVQAQNDFLALGTRRAIEQETSGSERESRTRVPFLRVDGLAKTGQTWVRQGSLTATVVVPPTSAQALEILVTAMRGGTQPPERTLVSPRSFPEPKASYNFVSSVDNRPVLLSMRRILIPSQKLPNAFEQIGLNRNTVLLGARRADRDQQHYHHRR